MVPRKISGQGAMTLIQNVRIGLLSPFNHPLPRYVSSYARGSCVGTPQHESPTVAGYSRSMSARLMPRLVIKVELGLLEVVLVGISRYANRRCRCRARESVVWCL